MRSSGGSVLVGENCVIGNSTELKNVIIFNNVQVPHYNYVGDSVLGFKSHMGAGSITSNVKSDKTLVHVKGNVDGQSFDIATGLKKFGAMLGDNVEVGREQRPQSWNRNRKIQQHLSCIKSQGICAGRQYFQG